MAATQQEAHNYRKLAMSQLEHALDEDAPREKNYHIRSALQALVINLEEQDK